MEDVAAVQMCHRTGDFLGRVKHDAKVNVEQGALFSEPAAVHCIRQRAFIAELLRA